MRALRKLTAEAQVLELVDVPAPVLRDGWVLLDVVYAGICGTDLQIAGNHFPSWPPVTLGHEFVGTVRESRSEDVELGVGDRVVCEPHALACGVCHLCRRGHHELCAAKRSPGWGIDGGMAEQVAVPGHLLHRVPEEVSDVAAALCEPTAIVTTAFERSPIAPGSSVLVVGPGPIGLLSALVARACGAGRTVVVGRPSSRSRLELARELGLEVWDSGTVDVVDLARRETGGRGVDMVVETSGSATGVAVGIGALRRRGALVVLGMSHQDLIEVPWGLAMNRALDVSFSLSSSWSSWDAALALMRSGAVDPRPLATVFALEDWSNAFEDLAQRSVVKALLAPNGRAPAPLSKGIGQ
jgi:L-iditol 2-dehydrogenase